MNRAALYVRTIIFGITDSLVSTVGLLAGIDVSGAAHPTLVLTGVVYAFVEAFSMAVGSFLSEESAEEYTAQKEMPLGNSVVAGVVMFVAFVVASFVPLAPYVFLGDPWAIATSIGSSVIVLFIAGLVSGRFARVHPLARALRMALLGGAAITIGALVGAFVKVS